MGFRFVITRPKPTQVGHLAIEYMSAVRLSHILKAPLIVIADKDAVDPAIYDLVCPGFRTFTLWGRGGRWLYEVVFAKEIEGKKKADNIYSVYTTYTLFQIDKILEVWTEFLNKYFYKSIRKKIQNKKGRTQKSFMQICASSLRQSLAKKKKKKAKKNKVDQRRHCYFKRMWLNQTPPLVLRKSVVGDAEKAAIASGVDFDKPIVMLHIRESGFKKGREVHEMKGVARDDSARNAHFENYIPAIDRLVSQGMQVVRIGDSSMTPVDHPGVIDLATSEHRTAWSELYCFQKCLFFIGGDSGPLIFGSLVGKPTLGVNGTNPISMLPVKNPEIIILKRVMDKATGKYLALSDMPSLEYMSNLRNTDKFKFVESTSEEIIGAVEEILRLVDGDYSETLAQKKYRLAVINACKNELKDESAIRKWGLHGTFITGGFMGAEYADKYFDDRSAPDKEIT